MNCQKIGYRVNFEIDRPSAELVEQVRQFSPTDLCDGMVIAAAMDYHIKPMVTTKSIAGPAVTLRLTQGDSLLVTKALAAARPGDVIVIEGHGSGNNALWGDHRSMTAKMLGLEAVVIDGAFRDIDEAEAIGFPIYAKAVTCGSSTKNSHGEVNVPVSCGGIAVNPGDIIVGDRNGVCVIPRFFVEETLENAREKIEKMNKLKKEISAGKIIPDNFAEQMRKLGY